MNVDAGRGKLYDALKTLQARWAAAESVWQDATATEFREKIYLPLEALTLDALRAADRLDQLFRQVRADCQGDRSS